MSIYEVMASIFSLASVYLTAKESKWCWHIGIIGIIFYMILFYQNSLYGNFYLQFLFIGQSLLGIKNWGKTKEELKPTWSKDILLLLSIFILSLTIITITLDENFSKMPIMDGLTTTLSIFGMFLLAYKKIDAWLYWIVADIIFVVMFYQSGLLVSAGTYSAFLILAIIGLFKWIKSSKTD